jgi:hypothetical protein
VGNAVDQEIQDDIEHEDFRREPMIIREPVGTTDPAACRAGQLQQQSGQFV